MSLLPHAIVIVMMIWQPTVLVTPDMLGQLAEHLPGGSMSSVGVP